MSSHLIPLTLDHLSEALMQGAHLPHRFYIKMEKQPTFKARARTHTHTVWRPTRGPLQRSEVQLKVQPGVIFDSQLKG